MRNRRLHVGVVALLVLLALTSLLITRYSVARIDEQLLSSEDFHTDALTIALILSRNASETAQEALAYVASGDVEERGDARGAIVAFRNALAELVNIEALTDTAPAETELLAMIAADHEEFESSVERLFAGYEAAGAIDRQSFTAFEQSLDTLKDELAQLIDIQESEVVAAQRRAQLAHERSVDSVVLQGAIIAGLALLAGVVTLLLFRRITDFRDAAQRDLSVHLQAIEATSIGIVIADLHQDDAPLIYVNPAFEMITGYRRADVLGRNCRFLQGPRTDAAAVSAMRSAVATASPISVLIENYKADGSAFWNELQLSPIRDESGAPTHFVGVLEDVTERMRLEHRVRQTGKMDAVGQLAGGVAHDFNNYLMVISAAIEVIKHDPDADITYWLDQITEAGSRSAALTTQLMAFASAQVLAVDTIDLNSVVRSIAPLLRSTIPANVAIEVTTTDDECLILGDRSQLDQVVTNIVLNARDALPDGGAISIETRTRTLNPSELEGETHVNSGPFVVLSITDNGTGIDPEIAADIFEPFTTTKPHGLGAGLGLATVYGIVSQAGGLITVYTEPGHGTTFTIYLPKASTSARADAPAVSTSHTIGFDGPVLLVEDDLTVRTALRAMLDSLGLSVLESGNGVEAMRVLEAHPETRLLISDVMMPEMGGIELADRCRTLIPDIQVLLMSGYVETTGRGSAHDPMLAKPFTLEELERKLVELTDAALR